MAERELLVRIVGDDRDLQRALNNTERKVTSVDNRMSNFGKNATRAFRGSIIVAALASATREANVLVQAGSDLNEQITRSEQVFGASAASVKDWSAGLASAFGVSQTAALEFAGTFGLLFHNIGISETEAADFSEQLVELAADLASFNNTTVDDALNALRSGLTGEIEPLRRYGVFLNEARSNQVALAETGKTSSKALTTQEKVLARLNIIMQDTAKAQGDFARTSDGLANKQRVAAAEAQNLAAKLGQGLAPAMDIALISTIGLLGGINDLIDGLGHLRDAIDESDFAEGWNDALQDAGDAAVDFGKKVRDQIPGIEHFLDLRNRFAGIGDETPSAPRTETGPQRGAAGRAATRLKAEAAAAADVQREARRAAKAYDALIKGLGLKLDKAGLTVTLDDDISALRELERAILRRIEVEGKTFKLVTALTQTRLQINALVTRQAEDARQAGVDAFEATMDALDLDLEMAQATKSLADDQKALRAIEAAILKRIQAEGATTDLLRQLFNVRQQQQDVARQLAEQRRENRQKNQFEQLGLTEEGERPTPGAGALRRRLKSLREQIKGTTLDTEKTRRELDRIAAVLSGKFGAVGKEVRNAILQMFNDIAGALEDGQSGRRGPLTKTSGLNTAKVLEGLGLTDEQINELRSRLAKVNSAGRQLAPSGGTSSTGTGSNVVGGRTRTEPGVVVENFVTVEIDGQKIASTVTKQQQKQKRRNPPQKRGPNRHR